MRPAVQRMTVMMMVEVEEEEEEEEVSIVVVAVGWSREMRRKRRKKTSRTSLAEEQLQAEGDLSSSCTRRVREYLSAASNNNDRPGQQQCL